MNDRRRGLGRGLSALMSDVREEAAPPPGSAPKRPDARVPVEKIRPNPDQPRRSFAREALVELAESVRAKGIIQPIIVREKPQNSGTYEIVAGERRWRAAQMAQLHEVPVLVRELSDAEVLELAIIENVQRTDLNPVEEAQGYRLLMDRFGHTQERLAEAMGKSRSHVANLLRLLGLPEEVLVLVREGKLSAGHARALVVLQDPVPLAKRAVAEGLSVRAVEQLAKAPVEKMSRAAPPRRGSATDADTRALEDELTATLRFPVTIRVEPGKQSGRVEISFASFDLLDDLCRILTATGPGGSR